MGVILMLYGLVGLLFSAIALVAGRLWFIRSRRHAGYGVLLSIGMFIVGGSLLDRPIGSSATGIALMVIAGVIALGALVRKDRTGWTMMGVAAIIGLLGVGVYADAHSREIDAAATVNWLGEALTLQRELETQSSPAYTRRHDPAVREQWSEWAVDWERRQREAERLCKAAARNGRLTASQEAACDAIVALDDVFDAYQDLIMDTDPTPRQVQLRKERLELSRRIVNQALSRTAP